MSIELDIVNNEKVHRFQAEIDGRLAVISYKLDGDVITFEHTIVPYTMKGQGIAGQMAHYVLEYARTQGLKVVPQCPFVAAYMKKHPEYDDLLASID